MSREQQESQIKLLIARGKEQGYLTYREVNDEERAALEAAGDVSELISMRSMARSVDNATGDTKERTLIELKAVERLLGNAASKATMSSTKSSTGHLLGAAGAIEAIFSILAIRDQVAPPTINLDNPAVETPLDLAPNAKRERKISVVMSNSFGFGGTNASVVMGAPR